MANNNQAEKEENFESKKILQKKINLFLADYFKWFVFLEVVIILTVGFFILLKPRYEQVSSYVNVLTKEEKKKLAEEQEKLLANKRKELEEIKKVLNDYNNLDKKEIEKINDVVPVLKNKEEMFTIAKYLAKNSNLTLTGVSLSGGNISEDAEMFKSIGNGNIIDLVESTNVSISVAGTNYNSLKSFLDVLENNLRLTDVKQVSFDPGGEATSLTFKVYYFKK